MTPELLDLLIAKAPALREAGIRSFSVGDTVVNLEPLAPEYKPPRDQQPAAFGDPMDDGTTYGTAVAPGYLSQLTRRDAWVTDD